MAVIAFWLVTIVLLNSFAVVYSFCAGNVLDTFCPKKLPVLRDWICNSWDALQDSRELTVPAKSTISPVYLHYLESEDSTIDRQRAWLQDLRPVVQDFAGRLRIPVDFGVVRTLRGSIAIRSVTLMMIVATMANIFEISQVIVKPAVSISMSVKLLFVEDV